ncbi:SusD family protein [Cyclonatronum proteinivorum]|uniref:SusD family protein n=1 Tax=Cyclonatronum proteinivorum TaxID=1457365 RepID=A0A345UIB6_9BACT|nr:RagB/SusD family nutrient uptake outer membrane protein [Cyclonatronum proteinivorum]AXJ00218.1 SusD family protein [Cyclonatronum proteinivorum]
MLKKIATLAAVGFGALTFYACDSLLDTQPRQSISPEVALDDITGIRGIAASAYNRLVSTTAYSNTRVAAPEVLADNGVQNPAGTPSGRYVSQAINTVGTGVGGWGLYYGMINDTNYILSVIDDLDAPPIERNRIKGEMLFLRALAYHDLSKSYGYEPGREIDGWDHSVIIRTAPTSVVEEAQVPFPRASNVEVYEQIESDLLESIALLSEFGGTNRFLANRAAADALLARVYLYWGRYADAVQAATNAMETPLGAALSTPVSAGNIFNSTSTAPGLESFFELRITSNEFGGAVNDGLASLFTPAQWFDIVPSEELKAIYDATSDVRFLEGSDGIITGWYSNRRQLASGALAPAQTHSIKFNQSVESSIDNTPILRFAEALLNRAESYARLGQDANALADLNLLRVNRGLDEVNLSGFELLEEILVERRRELAFEGHRWFDLKRLNEALEKPEASGVGIIAPSDFRWLSQVPITQVAASNGVILQNPGYADDED